MDLAAERAAFVLLSFVITFILGLPHLGSVMHGGLSRSLEDKWEGQRLDAVNTWAC